MKTIDQYLSELPEPERTMCLEARAKGKERSPLLYDAAQTADSMADAIMTAFGWVADGGDHDKFDAIHTRAVAGEFDNRAPKTMAADPLAERMEAMFTDVLDRLARIENGLAVMQSGATFMQELGRKAVEPAITRPTMDSNDKTAIYIQITLGDEAYDDIHPDLIAQDIMPAYTMGYQWERVDAMPMGEVRKMLEEILSRKYDYRESMGIIDDFDVDSVAAKYGITNLTDHG